MCARCAWSVSIGLLMVLVIGGCVNPEGKLRQDVMLQIARLDANYEGAIVAIQELGLGAVPYITAILLDPATTPGQQLLMIHVLGRLQSKSAIPALVKVADVCTDMTVTDEILKDENCPQMLSLKAQRIIARMVDPNVKRPGSFRSAFPDPYNPSTLAAQRVYYTDVLQWYREWRSRYDERKFVCNP